MKSKRILIIHDLIESCRLLPTWIQSIFFIIILGSGMYIIPVFSYLSFKLIIIFQIIIIILLIQKNIVYHKLSKIDAAIKRKIIWIRSKRDEKEKNRKRIVSAILLLCTILIFNIINNKNLLIINIGFCFIFFLKVLFYVPILSVRIFEDENLKFIVIDKGKMESTLLNVHEISSIEISSSKMIISTTKDKFQVLTDFYNDKEKYRLTKFLKKINKFEIK